ncbi:hypothetical protein NX059_011602 [Plenodomus lindquistii]|nr:hypothetical protein NX059_011602 [Plenodomus lindquistii]
MSNLNGFVNRHRDNSPAQTNHNFTRRAIGANAKVSVKDSSAAQKHQPQPQPQPQAGLPSRGFGNVQNSSATMQQRQQGHKRDLQGDVYDTDAESLDTTVNPSIVKDDTNRAERLPHEPQEQTADHFQSSDSDGVESEDPAAYEDRPFNEGELDILRGHDMLNVSYERQVQFLQSVDPRQGFRTVDGDSYPSTTDGQPTQWEEQPPPSEDYAPDEAVAPARLAVKVPVSRPVSQQAQQYGQLSTTVGHGQKPSDLFHQGQRIRAHQRTVPQVSQRITSHAQPNAAPLPSSQAPTYSQANVQTASAIPIQLNGRLAAYGQNGQASQPVKRTLSNPHRMQLPRVQPMAPPVPANGRAVSGTLRRPIEDEIASEASDRPNEDYNHEKLFAMSYDDLKSEIFDLDPRSKPPLLGEDILQKSLVERLEYVQKNLDGGRQSEFFSSLPTTEWEDAGDWFLEKFQSIIQRTREARQTKRKLAQGFEDEVEKRYKHVSKKQHQVEGAMDKMKQQGEGLVPKSPKPSKSPRPRKHGHA